MQEAKAASALNNPHIITIYDIDQAVLLMTGRDLKLTTPNDVLTARDTLEYWAQKHMAVARGDAVVVTNDGRRLAADTLVAYTTEAPHPGQAPQQATKVASKPSDKPSAEQDRFYRKKPMLGVFSAPPLVISSGSRCLLERAGYWLL